jgi:hypothetical protein
MRSNAGFRFGPTAPASFQGPSADIDAYDDDEATRFWIDPRKSLTNEGALQGRGPEGARSTEPLPFAPPARSAIETTPAAYTLPPVEPPPPSIAPVAFDAPSVDHFMAFDGRPAAGGTMMTVARQPDPRLVYVGAAALSFALAALVALVALGAGVFEQHPSHMRTAAASQPPAQAMQAAIVTQMPVVSQPVAAQVPVVTQLPIQLAVPTPPPAPPPADVVDESPRSAPQVAPAPAPKPATVAPAPRPRAEATKPASAPQAAVQPAPQAPVASPAPAPPKGAKPTGDESSSAQSALEDAKRETGNSL